MSLWERIAAAFQDRGETSEIEVARVVLERQALAGELMKMYQGGTEAPHSPGDSHDERARVQRVDEL